MTSDKALFSPCCYRAADMADLVQADDLVRLVVSGGIYAVPSSNQKCPQKSGMNCLNCWRDDQHPVAQNDFGSGEAVVLDEVHHRAEMST